MTTAAQFREIRRSESCKWFPVSAPRPIKNGVCVMRAYRRAPSGETTSRTASPARGTVSGIGQSLRNCNMREEGGVPGSMDTVGELRGEGLIVLQIPGADRLGVHFCGAGAFI